MASGVFLVAWEEHCSKPQPAWHTEAHVCFVLVQSDFLNGVWSPVHRYDRVTSISSLTPTSYWKGLAKPNLKAIFLLKWSILISSFHSSALRESPLQAGNKATNAKTQFYKNIQIWGVSDVQAIVAPLLCDSNLRTRRGGGGLLMICMTLKTKTNCVWGAWVAQ